MPYLLASPPVRGRGLKQSCLGRHAEGRASPPVRGRGLKLMPSDPTSAISSSPPVRGRGLKLFNGISGGFDRVAPRAGARIETRWRDRGWRRWRRRPPCGGAD